MTTVGYGELTPKTVGGRVVGIVLMFVGVSFLLTAAIASRFVREERSSEHEEMMAALQQIQSEPAESKARTGG